MIGCPSIMSAKLERDPAVAALRALGAGVLLPRLGPWSWTLVLDRGLRPRTGPSPLTRVAGIVARAGRTLANCPQTCHQPNAAHRIIPEAGPASGADRQIGRKSAPKSLKGLG